MKNLYWISSVDLETNTFLAAAAIMANSASGACDKAKELGIVCSATVEVVCFQLPWEARHDYKGCLGRRLSKDDVVRLGCKSIRQWDEERGPSN